MELKEFLESVTTLLENGVYYCDKSKNGLMFEAPLKIKQISDKAIMVEFFNPQDTFILTVQRHEYDEPKIRSGIKDKS